MTLEAGSVIDESIKLSVKDVEGELGESLRDAIKHSKSENSDLVSSYASGISRMTEVEAQQRSKRL